ncbi:MAG: ABC transporter substrate-binding protein, partial [Cetobacterium sp.]
KRKRVFYYTSSGTTSGKGTTFDSISEIGGFINASSEMGINGRGVISKEKIIEMNPDIILVPTVSQKYKHNEFIDELLKDKSLSNIDAVKNNQVYSVENKYLTAVSQKMILGLEKIVCIVYPEIFSEQEGEK